jgi:hypothetical protein
MRSIAALAFVLSLALFPSAPRAAPTATCHCFQNRTFDPAEPASADPYILANARSSLLSVAFGVPKATLVRASMGGTTPEDLWIAHWAAPRIGKEASWLLGAVAETGSWKATLAGSRGLPPAFEAALARGAPPSELAALAVDDVAAARLGAAPAVLRDLREHGATSEQLVLSLLLAPRLKSAPAEVLARYSGGRGTWGSLLGEAGLEPKGIEAAVRAAVH